MRSNKLIGEKIDGTVFEKDLENWIDLKHLQLQRNDLKKINIFNLMFCLNLESLDLSYNQLSEIDLSSLITCRMLEKINLAYNKFESINLGFFSNNQSNPLSLKKLNLSNNELTNLDLTPLLKCRNLETLDFSNNHLSELDLSSFAYCKDIVELKMDRNVTIGWRNTMLDTDNLSIGLSKYSDNIVYGWEEYMKEIKDFQNKEPKVEERLRRSKWIIELEQNKDFKLSDLRTFKRILYKEAIDCYIYGCFSGTIAVIASLIEYFLESEIDFKHIENFKEFKMKKRKKDTSKSFFVMKCFPSIFNKTSKEFDSRKISSFRLVKLAARKGYISHNLKNELWKFNVIRHGVMHYPEFSFKGILGFERKILRGIGKSRSTSFESPNRIPMLPFTIKRGAEKGITLFLDIVSEFNAKN